MEQSMSESKSAEGSTRLLQLDSLRGLAAIAVLLYHYFYRLGELQPDRVAKAWYLQHGHFGVELFFILSGLVITMTTDRNSAPLTFARARFFRLYPVFWAAILFTAATVYLLGFEMRQVGATAILANFTMIPRLLGFQYVDGVYWTLQVELFFYFIIGALLLLRLKSRTLEILTLLVLLSIAVRFFPDSIIKKLLNNIFILKYISLFTIGCLIYQTKFKGISPLSIKALSIFSLCVAGQALYGGLLASVITFGLSALMFCAVHYKIALLQNRVLVFIGAISYSLYLIHQNFGYAVILKLMDYGIPHALAAIVAALLSCLIAWLFFTSIETPVNNWAKQHWKKKSTEHTASPDQTSVKSE
jgi:peptidoglycan/LPS O-acetylase OafA/YrhL